MLTTEIQRLLGFGNAADEGAGHQLPSQHHRRGMQEGIKRAQIADERQGAADIQGRYGGVDDLITLPTVVPAMSPLQYQNGYG